MSKTNISASSSEFQPDAHIKSPYLDVRKAIVVMFAGTFFLSLVILEIMLPAATKNVPRKIIREFPVIAWHTNTHIHFPRQPLLTCENGSHPYKCVVYAPEKGPAFPEAYLFYARDIDKLPLPRDPETIWGLIHEESPTSKPMLLYEKALNLFNYSATFSRNSDVPVPLFWLRGLHNINRTKYFVNTTTKNYYLQEIAPVLFLQTDCFTFTQREAYVKELLHYIQVDCYGNCLRNKELPFKYESYIENLFDDELLKFLARYKFVVTIENAVCNDYITEKLWRALELGVVPIYFGSPLIRDWLPNNKSAILLEDFATPKDLSDYLHYLLNNDTAYEEYLEHKTLHLISNKKLIDEITTRPFQNHLGNVIKQFQCFICGKLHGTYKHVNIVTKKHYECPLPISALTKRVNMDNDWLAVIREHEARVDEMIKEITDSNTTRRNSKTSWFWFYVFD